MRAFHLLAALGALAAPAIASAASVDASSTTAVSTSNQPRYRGGTGLDNVTVSPALEIISVRARDLEVKGFDELQLVVSGFGSLDLDSQRSDRGTKTAGAADLSTGYVEGLLAGRRLTLRLGRTQVTSAAASGVQQIDGAQARALLAAGFQLSAYCGAPVSQRVTSRKTGSSWNPNAGAVAYGGRLGWSLSAPGLPGRGVDLGVSVSMVDQGSNNPVRRDLGADFRLQPLIRSNLTVSGNATYGLYDSRLAQAVLLLTWTPLVPLDVSADWRFAAPDLLLPRNSVLSVFSASEWQELGGGLHLRAAERVTLGADYHVRLEPGKDGDDAGHIGHDAVARASWAPGRTLLVAEGFLLSARDNGYVGGRLSGRQDLDPFFLSADVEGHSFRVEVNGKDYDLTGTLSGGTALGHGFSGVLSGRAFTSPYTDHGYELMAKLVFDTSGKGGR